MTHAIPKLLPPEDMPPVRSLADLDHTWRALMGRLGFGASQLWALMLDERGKMLPGIVKIEECPQEPEPELAANLYSALQMVLDLEAPCGSVALLWARPGGAGMTPGDLAWARTLTDAGRASPLRIWPIHVANDQVLRIVTPDDLAA